MRKLSEARFFFKKQKHLKRLMGIVLRVQTELVRVCTVFRLGSMEIHRTLLEYSEVSCVNSVEALATDEINDALILPNKS